MAKIFDPDLLADSATDNGSTEVFINTSTKRIKLNVTGDLSNTGVQNENGVTLKALYSFLKEEWRTDPHAKNLAAFDFPMVPITDEAFEFVAGWDFENALAEGLIRDAGWTVYNTSGVAIKRFAGIIGLGSIESDDQLYYQQVSGGATTDVLLTGQVNQAVQIYSDTNGDGTPDYNYASYFSLFAREQAQKYGKATLSTIGVTTMAAQAYRFPISTSSDAIKITHSDGTVSTTAPYTGMSIIFYAAPQSILIGASNYDFGIQIVGNSGTAEEIYEFVQWSLRQASDIDAGAGAGINGNVVDELLEFVGDTLKTKSAANYMGGGTGVYITGYLPADETRLVFVDNTGTERTYPYNAVLQINFGDNLKNDASAKYWVYFSTLPGVNDDFGEPGALLVDDKDGVDMAGDVSGASFVQKQFAYDTNVQGGRTAATDANITVIGIGLNTGQHVKATGTIQRTTSNSVSLVAALERNYSNP